MRLKHFSYTLKEHQAIQNDFIIKVLSLFTPRQISHWANVILFVLVFLVFSV